MAKRKIDTLKVINTLNMETLDHQALQHAVSLLEQDTLTEKMTQLVGSPIDYFMNKLPSGIEAHVHKLVETALYKATDAALWSLSNKPNQHASTKTNKVFAALSGALGGAFGFAALGVELPVSTTIMLRSVADIARSEGFDLADIETKHACLEVFALGGPKKDDDAVETAYYSARTFITETMQVLSKELSTIAAKQASSNIVNNLTETQTSKWFAALIEKVATRFGIVITEKVAAQAVPIIGAVAGATLNTMFTDYYQDMARGHFIIKRLEKKYGYELIHTQYQHLVMKKSLKINKNRN